MNKNEKGFHLFFDWIERLKELPPEDSIKIVYAIGEYYKNGIDPTEQFKGTLKVVAALMFDQIKRGEKLSEIRSEVGRKGGFATAKSGKATAKPQQNAATYNNITNNDITNNDNNNGMYGSAHARGNVESYQQSEEEFEDVEFKIVEYFAKHHFESNAEDFIAYNKSRSWKGFGGEDVRNDYSRYADRWEDEHLRRIGFKT